jgi:uncharacterized protein (TIGR03067 family)
MGKYVVVVVAFAFMAAVCAADEDAAKAELKKLEGTWQLVSSVKDGKEVAKEVVKKVRVVIKGSKHTVYFGNDVAAKEIPFTIDPTKNPKTAVDTLPGGKEIKGIYKLDGYTLTSCVAEVGKERPTEFVSKPGSGHTLRVLKRVKP